MSLPPPAANRTCLVTGASSGIGAEIARQLAGRGHGVTLVARREAALEQLATELAATGVRAEVLAADLGRAEDRAALPARVAALDLTVDVLVNNAGFSTAGPVSAADPEAELQLVAVDVAAVADLCTRFLPDMVQRHRGAVLNVASTAAFQPLPGQAAYGAAKAFVLSYTRSLAGELCGSGVSVTALCPGPVDTGFGAAAGIDQRDAEAALPRILWESPEAVARCGLDALASGRLVAIPGPLNRVAAMAAHLTPKALLLPIIAHRHPSLRHGR